MEGGRAGVCSTVTRSSFRYRRSAPARPFRNINPFDLSSHGRWHCCTYFIYSIMDFTEIYKQTSSLVAFSAGAHFILTAVQDRVIVRRADTFLITRTWLIETSPTPTHTALMTTSTSKQKQPQAGTSSGASQDNWITHVGWSCDSEYVLAACAKRGVVHILKLRDEEWRGRIDAGAEGD